MRVSPGTSVWLYSKAPYAAVDAVASVSSIEGAHPQGNGVRTVTRRSDQSRIQYLFFECTNRVSHSSSRHRPLAHRRNPGRPTSPSTPFHPRSSSREFAKASALSNFCGGWAGLSIPEHRVPALPLVRCCADQEVSQQCVFCNGRVKAASTALDCPLLKSKNSSVAEFKASPFRKGRENGAPLVFLSAVKMRTGS